MSDSTVGARSVAGALSANTGSSSMVVRNVEGAAPREGAVHALSNQILRVLGAPALTRESAADR